MDQRRRVEHDRNRKKLPEPDVVIKAGVKRVDGDIAERVVEKMANQLSEQYHPAGQANLPDADASDQSHDLLLGESCHAI
jgi:hypothetical protein